MTLYNQIMNIFSVREGLNKNAQLMRHVISRLFLFLGILKPANVAGTPNQPNFMKVVNEDIFRDDNDLGYC